MVGTVQVAPDSWWRPTRPPDSSHSLALASNSLLEFHLSISRLSSGPLPHPHLCDRECCLGICSKTIAKFRNANANYLAQTLPEQPSSVLGYRSPPHSLRWGWGGGGRGLPSHPAGHWVPAPSLTRFSKSSCPRRAQSEYRQYLENLPWCLAQRWLCCNAHGAWVSGTSVHSSPFQGPGRGLRKFINNFILCPRGLKKFTSAQVPQNMNLSLLWPNLVLNQCVHLSCPHSYSPPSSPVSFLAFLHGQRVPTLPIFYLPRALLMYVAGRIMTS